jgi:hypothetical protein
MDIGQVAQFHSYDAIAPIIIAIAYVAASSMLREPARRNFNAIMIGGGGLGVWEFAFTAVVTFCAFKGLQSYWFIGVGWMLHTGWDILHHFYGHPIIPYQPLSSAGCAITDALIAMWFFAGAPSLFETFRKPGALT